MFDKHSKDVQAYAAKCTQVKVEEIAEKLILFSRIDTEMVKLCTGISDDRMDQIMTKCEVMASHKFLLEKCSAKVYATAAYHAVRNIPDQAKEFIDQKEERFDMEISQGGTNVSGGQKQRLAIARAIAKNPDIYIFDDSFSALDFKTDAKLRQELNQLVKKTKSTVLLVGQRIASIMDADQIIVLDEGRIVGKGTHEELMKSCQVYQEIAYSQLSKEELSHE